MRRRRIAALSLVLLVGLGASYSVWSNRPSEARQKLQEMGLAVTWQQLAETEPKGSNGIELLRTRIDPGAAIARGHRSIDPKKFIAQNHERREFIRELAKFDTCHPEDWANYAFKQYDSVEAQQLLKEGNFAYIYAMCLIEERDFLRAVETLKDLDRISEFFAQTPNFYGILTCSQLQNHIDTVIRFALRKGASEDELEVLKKFQIERRPLPSIKPVLGTVVLYWDDYLNSKYSLLSMVRRRSDWNEQTFRRSVGSFKGEVLLELEGGLLKTVTNWPENDDYLKIAQARNEAAREMLGGNESGRLAIDLFPDELGTDMLSSFEARRRATLLATDLLITKNRSGYFADSVPAEQLIDPQTTMPFKFREIPNGFRIISAAMSFVRNDMSGDDELGFEYPGKLPEWSKRTWPQF